MRNLNNRSNTERDYYNQDNNRFDYNRDYNNEFYGVNNQYNDSQLNNNIYGNNSYPTNNNYNNGGYSNNTYPNNYENDLYNQNRFATERVYVKPRKKGSMLPLLIVFLPIPLMFVVVAFIIITSFLGIGEDLSLKMIEVLPFLIIAGIAFIAVYSFINETKRRISRKRNCQYNIKALIVDVHKVHRSDTYYVPIIMYCFRGKEYIINDNTQRFNYIEPGTEIDMAINQNDPEEFYIETFEKNKDYMSIFGSITMIAFAVIFIIFINTIL